MGTGAAADADDAGGVELEFGGVFAGPADGGAGVLHGVEWGGTGMAGGDAVVDEDADHAAAGEVEGVGSELAEEAGVPCAAEEEESGGPAGGGRGTFRAEDVSAEVVAVGGFVDVPFGRVEESLVAVEDVGRAAWEGSAR